MLKSKTGSASRAHHHARSLFGDPERPVSRFPCPGMAALALAALLALPAAPAGAQTIHIDLKPEGANVSQAQIIEGSWAGFELRTSGTAPAQDVTVTCTSELATGAVDSSAPATRANLRASATATEPLGEDDPLPTDVVVLRAAAWGETRYCAIWTYDDLVSLGAGDNFLNFWIDASVTAGGSGVNAVYTNGTGRRRVFSRDEDHPTPTGARTVNFFPVGSEVGEGQTAVFDLVISSHTGGSFVVPYTISGDGITAADFTSGSLSGTYDVAYQAAHAGRNTNKLRLGIADAEAGESAETFTVTLGPPTSTSVRDVTFITTTASMTIVADADPDPADVTLSVEAANADVNEGDTAGFTFTLSAAYPGELRIRYSLTAGTGTDAADFSRAALGNQFFIIPAGRTTATDVYQVLVDGSAEAAETLTATVVSAGSGRWPSWASPPLVPHGTDNSAAFTIAASTDSTAETFAAAGITVTPDALDAEQGGSAVSYTVQLTRDPGTNSVTITPSAAGLSFSPASLQFDTTGGTNPWDTARTFMVTAAEDAAIGQVTTVVNGVSAAGGPYGGVTHLNGPVVTVISSARVELSSAALVVSQGGQASYAVTLSEDPGSGNTVTVTPSASPAGRLTFNPASLELTSSNYFSLANTIAVTANTGLGTTDITGTVVSHGVSAAAGSFADIDSGPDLPVTIRGAPPAVTVSDAMLTVEQGATVQYTVQLDTDPGAGRTITVTPSGTGMTFEPASIDFTTDGAGATSMWNAAQTVTITAALNQGVNTLRPSVSHALAAVPDTGPYMGITSGGFGGPRVTINGRAGLRFDESTLTVQQGATVQYAVTLDTDPGSGNSVLVTPSATGLTFNPASFTFNGGATANNRWNSDRIVTITAATGLGTSNTIITVSHAFSAAAGTDYDGEQAFPGPVATVAGAAGPLIVFTDGAATPAAITALSVTEEASPGAIYTVALSEDPGADVTVAISAASSDLRFSDTSGGAGAATLQLDFTSSDYNTAQTVYVNAESDDDGVSDSAIITHAATAASGSYMSASVDLPATITDNDAPSFTITGLMEELDETPTRTVNIEVLATVQPPTGSDLVGQLSSNIDSVTSGVTITFNPAAVTFTNANWNQSQRVAMTVDGLDSNGDEETVTISVTATSDTSAYDQAAVAGTAAFLYDEPTSYDWTVRSRGQGRTEVLNTNEDAQPIPNPNTADPGENPQPGENRDGTPASGDAAELAEDWMYFRFTAIGSDSDTEYPELPVTVTYCLGGAARGGTPAQVAAAAPRIYDYTWPQARTHAGSSQTTYNPRATSPTAAGYDGSCVGRGSFTTGTSTWHNIYRLPIELNDDNVNEDDEIISAVIVHVASADGHARVPASGTERFFTAQRRIIDNDDAQGFVRFGPKTATANEGEDFTFTVRLSDTAPDQLRVPWTTSGLSGVAAVPGSGTAVFAPGGETTQEVTLRIDLASALGSSSPTQELKIGFQGDLAGPGAAAFQKAESANDLTVDGIEFSGTSTVTISFVDEPVQLSATRLSVTEGDATGATYSVTLGSDPGAGETVTVTPTAPAGLTVTPASLTFDGSGGTSLWSTAQMFTVTAGEDDNGFDDSLVITHTVTTTQSSGDYAGFTDPLRVRVVVDDNDSRGVTVTPTTLSIPEGTQGFYTVRLTTEPVGGVVTVRLSDDDPDTTFTYAINTLVFTDSDGATPWDTPQTVAVDGVGEYSQSDSLIEHAVSGADYGGVGAASVRVIVTAASTAPTFSIALADSVTDADGDASTGVQVGEDVGSVAFTVSVAGTLTADATVGWAASGGTINPAADLTGYPATGRTLTFTTADSAPKTITLNINEDNVNEAAERLIVQLSNPAGGDNPLIAASSASVQITDNDPIEFTVARATPASGGINEGDSQSFTVTAGGSIAGASVTVPWFISIDADAATANAMPADFRATAAAEDTSALTRYPRGMFTFTAAGAQTVTVHTLDDTAGEPVEGFALYLGAPGGAAGAVEVSGAPAEVEIAASDAPGVTISTADVSVEEGGTVQYTVVLDTEPTGDVMVTPATGAAATATVSGALTFTASAGATPWDTAQTVTVTGVAAGSTTITHTVAGANYASVTAPSVAVTVVAAVTPPTFQIAVASTVTDADSDGTNGVQVAESVGAVAFTVTMTGRAPTASATVAWGAETGAGRIDVFDLIAYPATGRSLTFTTANYQTAQTITLTVADDSLNEATETLPVTLFSVSSTDTTVVISATAASADIQITDNDPIDFAVARATPASGEINEGGSQSFTITPSGGGFGGATVLVPWSVGADSDSNTGDAAAGDFRADADATTALGAFPASSTALSFTDTTAQTVTVYTFNDAAAEGAEVFVFQLGAISGATGGTTAGSQAVTIASSDAALTITCTAVAGLADLVEGTATTVANCAHSNTAPLVADVGVGWTVFTGSGVTHTGVGTSTEASADFSPSNGALTIPQGTAGGVMVPLQLTATDDSAAEAAEEFSLVVTGTQDANRRYADIDAATLNYAQDITVAQSAAGGPQFNIAVASSVTDADGDANNGVQVGEDAGSIAFTVTVTGTAPTADIGVTWAVSGVQSGDYTTTDTSPLTFTSTNHGTAQTITLTVTDDGVNEAAETLTVTLSSPTGTDTPTIASGAASAAVQITDNDALTFTVARKTPATGAITEGNSQVFSVTPGGGTIASGTSVSVPWSIGIDSASATADAAAGDFRATGDAADTTALGAFPSATLTFTSHTAQDVTVWTLDDSTGEGAETFQFNFGTISGADGATSTGGAPLAVQIAASDVPTFSVTPETNSLLALSRRDESFAMDFNVIGSGPAPTGNVEITCTVSSTEAVPGDFLDESNAQVTSGNFPTETLTFTPTDYNVEQQCQFSSYDDDIAEDTEEFTVTITVTSGTAAIGTASTTGAILINDFRVGFENSAYSIDEGSLGNSGNFGSNTGRVCVSVTNPPSDTAFPSGVTFSLAFSSTDVTAGSSDYTAVTNQSVGPFTNSIRQECASIEVAHDLLNEGAESFRLSLTPPPGQNLSGVTINPSQATVTIPADDPLTVTVSGPTQVEEGASAEFTLAFASVDLMSPDGMHTETVTYEPTADVVVNWALSGTGITTTDFTGVTSLTTGNSHTITLSNPDYTFDLAVAEEIAQDPDDVPETFTLTVTGGTSAGGVAAAASDAASNVNIVAAGSTGALFTVTGPSTIAEGAANVESTDYTVTLSGLGDGESLGTQTEVTWTVTHAQTGGTVDADFPAASDRSGTETFAATADNGDTQTFTISIAADNLNEGDEDFSVQVSASGFRAGAPATTTITDEAADATTVTIARDSGTQASVGEAASASFTVTLAGGVRTGVITVPVSFGGLSADSPNEYDITAPSSVAATAAGVDITFDLSGTPGATDSQTVTVDLMDDTVNEATETLTLSGAAAGATGLRIATGSVSYATNGDSASVEVTDDDSISVTIAVAGTDADSTTDGHQRAELTDATFTVTLTDGASTPVAITSAADATIPYTIGGDVETADYTDRTATVDMHTTSNGMLVIPAGSSTGIITIRLLNDGDTDTTEDLTVTLTAANPSAMPPVAGPTVATGGGSIAVTGTAASATAKIVQSTATRTLTVTGPATLTETDADFETGNYTVTLTGAAFASDTIITWTVTHGTTEDGDFAAASDRTGTVMFTSSDGDASTKNFTFTVAGDDVNEANETFTVQVSGGGASTAYGVAAMTTINDDDAVTYSIAADAASRPEGVGSAEFTVTLSGSSEGDVTIPVGVTGTAASGDDYTAPASTVTIAAGQTTADFDIALINDNLAEGDETIIATVAAESDAAFSTGAAAGAVTRTTTVADQSATVTIRASDALVLSIARKVGESGAITEAGTTSANFTVTVSGNSPQGVSATFTVSGTDITAADYDITAPLVDHDSDAGTPEQAPAATATSGTINIPAGADQSAEITIQASDDSEAELAETLTVTLSGLTAPGADDNFDAPAGTTSATVGITDNDGITATAAAATASSVTEGGSFSITVSIPAAHTQDITFTVTPGSTAVGTDNDAESADYGTPAGLTLSAGSTSTDITIAATADTLNEGDETFTVTIAGSTTGRAGGPTIPVTVAGAGATQTLTVQDDAADTITVTITRQTPAGASIGENGDGAATADVIFRVALTGGTRTAIITMPFTLSGLENAEYNIASTLDSATDPAAAATTPAATATGGVIHFTLSGTPSATDHRDITVNLQGDDLNEATETLTITGAAPGASGLRLRAAGGSIDYAASGGNAASVDITDDDAITYSVANATAVTEVDSGGSNPTMRFVVSLSGASAGAVTIPYAVSGTATGGTDYTAPGGSVTIAAGATSANIDITVLADNLNEPVETIIITLDPETDGDFSKGAAAGAVTRHATAAQYTATGNINDDDGVTLTLSGGGDVAEGANASVTVTLSNEAMNNGMVTVNYTIGSTTSASDNDAEAADYTNTSGGSITINTDSTLTGNITIAAANDLLNEGDETFEVRVANSGTSLGGGVTVTGSPQTFTIKDAAADAIQVTITKQSPSGNSVDEEASVTFRVALSSTGNAVRTADVVVPFTVTGLDNAEFAITAPSGIADTATGGSVTFGLGGTPSATDYMDITINLQADDLNEAAETLTVTGAAAGSGTTNLRTAGAISYTSGGNTANISVTDNANDAIQVTISQQTPASNAAAGENATATFRVALSGGVRTSNIFVPFTFSGTLSNAEYAITSALDHDNNPATAGQVPGASANGGVVSFGTSSPMATEHVDITVNLQGDDLNEATETLIFEGVAPGGGTNVLRVDGNGGSIGFAAGGGDTATLNVSDDDDILYTIDAGPSTAEADSGTPLMQFTVRIDHESAGDITIPYTLGGTATGGAASVPTRDYTTPSDRTVRIAAGTQSRTFGITVNPDNINEADETVIVTLGASPTVAAAGGTVARHGTAASYTSTGTITDDDSATAMLSTTTASRVEGQAFTARVTLSAEARNTGMITVNYTIGSTAATTDNDAESADYTDTSGGSITINTASTLTGDITVTSVNDTLNEGDETFTLAVAMSGTSLPGGVTVSGSPLTFTITDDPQDAIAVTIARQGAATRDEAGEVTFRVSLSSAGNAVRTADVVVPFAFTGTLGNHEYAITAPAGIMATATSGSVTFPVAGTPAHDDHIDVTVNLAGDPLNEATETLIITGAAAGASGLRTAGGAIAYTNNGDTDMVSVTDDDTTTVILRDQGNFNEGANGGWPVSVDVVSAGAITVNFEVTLSGTGTLSNVGTDQRLGAFTTGAGGVQTATGTLTIRAAALGGTITLHANAVANSVVPDGSTRIVTVTLTGVSAGAAGGTVNLSSTPADLTDDATITYRNFDRTFSAGLAPTTTTVNVDHDPDTPAVEASEDQTTAAGRTITFQVALTHASGGNFIPDNGNVTVTWTATVVGGGASGSNGVDELAAGTRTGTVRFVRDLDNSAVHNCGTSGDAVTGGGALQIPDAATCPAQNVEVQIAHDTINEAAQTVVFTLSMPAGDHGAGTGLSSDIDERVGILASDPITVSLGADASGNEGDSADGNAFADRTSRQIRITVTAAGATSSDWNSVRVPFTPSGTATQATSYAGISDPTMDFPTGGDYYTFTPDNNVQTVSIDLRAGRDSAASNVGGEPIATIWAVPQLDDLNEPDETVIFTLSAPGAGGYDTVGNTNNDNTGGNIGLTTTTADQSATATINDDDDRELRLIQTSPVGNSDLREGTAVTYRVELVTTGGTPALAASQEEITVAWSASVTQTNNDASAGPGADDDRPNDMGNADLASTGATAAANGGSISGASVIIPAGQTGMNFTVNIRQDARLEMQETVTVTLGAITTDAVDVNLDAANDEQTFTIEENPAATRFLNIGAAVGSATPAATLGADEGNVVTFTVTMTGDAYDTGAAAVTADWAITGTVEDADYSGGASGTVTFPAAFTGTSASDNHVAGALTETFSTTIAIDSLNEASETLIVTLSNVQGGSCDITADANCTPPTVASADTATVTIAESDDITYALASPSSLAEGSSATFTVNLRDADGRNARSEGDITVGFTIDSDGTATGGGTDYTDPTLTVTVPAGSTSATLEIGTADDNINEADETIIIDLSAETETGFTKADAAGAVTRSADAADQTQTATIRDNDAITISVARTSPSGNDEVEEGTAVTFTVTMAGAAGGSAGTVSIPWTARMVGQAAGTDPNGDPVSNDADTPDLTGPAGSTSSGGVEVTGTLEIASGRTGTVVITPTVDGIGEADERFTFTLGSPTNTAAGGRVSNGSPTSVTVGINENRAALHVVNVAAATDSVAEDAESTTGTASTPGSATFNISLTSRETTGPNARTAELIVAYTIGGTATGGASSNDDRDFTWPSGCTANTGEGQENTCTGTVTFPDGDDSDQSVTVNFHEDRIDDDAETVTITLEALDGTNGASDGTAESMFPGTASAAGGDTVTIADNDEAGLNFSVADDAMVEVLDGNTNTYTVALTSQPAAGSVVITPTVTAVTSTADPSTVTLDMEALTFTTANWHTAQTVEVQTDDLGVIADTDFRIDYAVTANAEAPAYSKTGVPGGVAVRIKAAVNLLSEPRTGGVNAGISMGNPAIEVAGQTATYPIVLGQAPTANVTIAFTIGVPTPPATTAAGVNAAEAPSVTQDADEMPRIVSGASLTFTSTNWNTAQNVVVAISEQVRGAYELRAAVTSTDANYASVGTRTLHIRVVPPVNRAVDTVNRVILPEVARAMADLQMSAVGNRLHRFRSGGGGAQLNLGGQSTLAGMAAANIQSMAKDGIDWKRMLADSSFHMPFSGGGGDGVGGGAFWGGGAYHSIGGDSDGVDWEGNIVGGHLGFDARVGGSALAGLLVSYNDVEIEDYTYNDTSLTGSPEITGDWLLDMTSVSPYLGWRRGALEGWAMAGYGEGELEIDERGHASRDGRSLETDVSMHTFGLGVSRSVERRRGREVRIKAEAFATRAEVDDGDDVTGHREAPISDLEVDANRVRLMLEFSGTRQLRGGADFGTSAEFGMRYDGGDGRTGGGSELGLGFHYHGAGGVSLQGRVRGLFGHSADWGASGSLKLQPGGDGQGLSLAVSPAYGRTAGGAQGVWNNGLFASDDSGDGVDLRARMEVEAGWGVKAFTDTGLLTPYSNMTFTDTGARTVSLGVEWQTSLGNGAGPGSRRGGVDFGLNLSAKRTNADDKAPEDAVVLKGTLRF